MDTSNDQNTTNSIVRASYPQESNFGLWAKSVVDIFNQKRIYYLIQSCQQIISSDKQENWEGRIEETAPVVNCSKK
jgi:hypothetical protein